MFTNISHHIVDHGIIPLVISDNFVIKSGIPIAKSKTIEYCSYRSYTKEAFVNDLNQIDWSIIDIVNDHAE